MSASAPVKVTYTVRVHRSEIICADSLAEAEEIVLDAMKHAGAKIVDSEWHDGSDTD